MRSARTVALVALVACGGRLAPGTQPEETAPANTSTGSAYAAPACEASGPRCVLCAGTWLCPSGSFAECPANVSQGGPCDVQPECLQCAQGAGAVYACSSGSWDLSVMARTETSSLCPP